MSPYPPFWHWRAHLVVWASGFAFTLPMQFVSTTATFFQVSAANVVSGRPRPAATRAASATLVISLLLCCLYSLSPGLGQPGQDVGGDGDLHVSDGQVVEHSGGDQVDGDAQEPAHGQVAADPCLADQDQRAHTHLYHAYDP